MHIKYSDAEKEPVTEASNVILFHQRTWLSMHTYLSWAGCSLNQNLRFWPGAGRIMFFFLFPHSKQETEKYNLIRTLQAVLDALKKINQSFFLDAAFKVPNYYLSWVGI